MRSTGRQCFTTGIRTVCFGWDAGRVLRAERGDDSRRRGGKTVEVTAASKGEAQYGP